MSVQTLREVRSRLVEVAIDLGWTPPGWREPAQQSRVIDRLGDVALGPLLDTIEPDDTRESI